MDVWNYRCRGRCCEAWLTLAVLLCASIAAGEEPKTSEAETPGKTPATLRELIDQSIEWYELLPSAEADSKADALPVLRWANNTRGSEDGTTVLYVHGGRPLAAACIYPWGPNLEHDFESLSRDRIVARRAGATVWQPQQPGVSFAAIPEAPDPEKSEAARLRQMKTLAEQFEATLLGWKVDNSDREELRLLPRPLYRYELKDGKVLDGAVFAFVMGTDPEVLLLIEAVRQDNGESEWQYAFARRTSGELEGRWRDKMVWQARRFPMQHDPRQPHFTLATRLPPEIEQAAAEQGNAAKP